MVEQPRFIYIAEIEGNIFAIQNGVIRTRYYLKYVIKDGEKFRHIMPASITLPNGLKRHNHVSKQYITDVPSSISLYILTLVTTTTILNQCWKIQELVCITTERLMLDTTTIHTDIARPHNRPNIVLLDKFV